MTALKRPSLEKAATAKDGVVLIDSTHLRPFLALSPPLHHLPLSSPSHTRRRREAATTPPSSRLYSGGFALTHSSPADSVNCLGTFPRASKHPAVRRFPARASVVLHVCHISVARRIAAAALPRHPPIASTSKRNKHLCAICPPSSHCRLLGLQTESHLLGECRPTFPFPPTLPSLGIA